MLRIENVTKLFNPGTPDEKVALSRINLHLNEGDFVTVIGSNGAGKSTLMNLISGVMTPDLGSVQIEGKAVEGLPEHRRSQWIGRVFQDPMAGTAPTMTIEENLALAYSRSKPRGLSIGVTGSKRKFFREQLWRLGIGLDKRLNAKVGLLSGGERQALSLLMATFTRPRILLLDEHTAALDPSRAELITTLTESIVSEMKLTTLMVTHNMEQAIRLGNRLIMMDKGSIILDVPPEKKSGLTVEGLLKEFERIRGEKLADDRVVLG
ncbi:ABC transporter ATP-binding protein [Paenibacillus mucilaginosus]|uniref:ABC transporter n=3 Tax=Paenibacillus mucilaginosus TaxID=61624 RepID=H6NL26_9BACL|nr:ABC transporter ATP-binding protein [Paenibacillus mucilaginosus]AEI41173.1 ABC transporter related protein [Paenibacillus mucilaginosus KNP414]AFC29733.1 ABC transporter [Paenibacillus mucilaginosus 3016]AFH61918.1 ABC transporter ATP-binding protein [Paenibacillus mucilaginosus K02]MCG7211398.1 ABC transporter ATP-binding protein [Paenibacillus mucilaginosus]WDM30224.1 ABC transporter ATP-binding protein [Paenibacillus mucilaginosus]